MPEENVLLLFECCSYSYDRWRAETFSKIIIRYIQLFTLLYKLNRSSSVKKKIRSCSLNVTNERLVLMTSN